MTLQKPFSISHGWKVEYLVITIVALLAIVYAYGQSNLDFIGSFSATITPFEAFAAFATAALLFKANSGRKGGGMSRAFGLYSLGMGCWFAAECIGAYYGVILGIEIPSPSFADAFWLLGYVPLLAALLSQAWPFRDAFSRLKLVLLALGMTGMIIIILVATIPPLFEQKLDSTAFLVSVSYPFLDALLLSVAIPVLIMFRKGSYWRPMLIVFLGIMLQLIADLAFAQGFLSGFYYPGSPVDMVFDLSYITLALGFYKARKPNLL
jgi:hypothetical protein